MIGDPETEAEYYQLITIMMAIFAVNIHIITPPALVCSAYTSSNMSAACQTEIARYTS
jgi:hypothetical protein